MILIDTRGDFPNQLGPDDCRNIVDVAVGIKFHDIRADNCRILSGKYRQDFAHRQATRLGMRHTRRLRRVKAIEIKTDVERPFKNGNMRRREVQHREYFNAITLRLFAAVAVQRPDTDLNNALGMARFNMRANGDA